MKGHLRLHVSWSAELSSFGQLVFISSASWYEKARQGGTVDRLSWSPAGDFAFWRMVMRIRTLLVVMVTITFLFPLPGAGQEKAVFGWLEKVRIYPGGLVVRAKLDTGAKTSSLTALNMVSFVRDSELWVRFDVADKKGKKITLEQKVHRVTRIKRHGAESQNRVAVLLWICLGKSLREVEFTLVDRTGFNYPMLLGRNFLAGSFLVDASAKFTMKPQCEEKNLQP
jgi:hypothetical protein